MKRATLIVAGLVVGFAIVEGVLRLTYTAPWYERLIATQQKNQQHGYRFNHDLLRDRDYPPKPADHRRVMLIGDSFVFGLGVFDEDAVLPRVLERGLNADLPSGAAAVDVLNAGMPGSLTDTWLTTWAG